MHVGVSIGPRVTVDVRVDVLPLIRVYRRRAKLVCPSCGHRFNQRKDAGISDDVTSCKITCPKCSSVYEGQMSAEVRDDVQSDADVETYASGNYTWLCRPQTLHRLQEFRAVKSEELTELLIHDQDPTLFHNIAYHFRSLPAALAQLN